MKDDDRDMKGPPRVAIAAVAAGSAIAAAVNVWTRVHDQPDLAGARLWEPIVWELSSFALALALLPLVWRGVLAVRRSATTAGAVAAGLGCALAFYVLHVAGFVLLRSAAYAVVGRRYAFGGLQAWIYELPKDLVTVAILAGVLLVGRRLAGATPPDAAPTAKPAPLRLRDGSRTFLVRPDEILAASASGNYVEYHLADGRRPLSRSRFGEAEALLAPHGFLRTHRSWLANRAHVREVRPTGSGDHELRVGVELIVPVSRRFAADVLAAVGAIRTAPPTPLSSAASRP